MQGRVRRLVLSQAQERAADGHLLAGPPLRRRGERLPVKADPGNEKFYEVRVVTAVRTKYGQTAIYHAAEGQTKADYHFFLSGQANFVRRWLPREADHA